MEKRADQPHSLEQLEAELATAKRELQRYEQARQCDLQIAERVHRSLLPQPIRHPRIDVDTRYIPVEEVGGDYCQVRFPYRDACTITMCDVTGHGIAAALLATRVSSEVRHSIFLGRTPGEIVRELNTFVCEHFAESNLFLSFTAARIDLVQRQVTWCGAGHPSPLLIHRHASKVEMLTSQNPLVGVDIAAIEQDAQETLSLEPGDRLVFYTDGLSEAADQQNRLLGVSGVVDIAIRAMSVDLFEMADTMLDDIAAYQHGPATDDKTLVVAEVE